MRNLLKSMPRTKTTRNPFGTILKKRLTLYGKKVTVWDARKRYTKASGEKAEKFKRCYAADEAQIALMNFQTEIKNELAEAETGKANERTFFELTEYFRETFCKPAVMVGSRQVSGYRQNPKSIESYLDQYKEYFGNIKLSEMTYEKIRKYREYLSTTPYLAIYGEKRLPKVSTVNRKLAYLRRLLNVGIQLRWMPHGLNPFNEGSPLIKTAEEEINERILTFEEEQKILAVCDSEKLTIKTKRQGEPLTMVYDNPYKKLKFIIILAIDTGLRQKELLSLQREDIRLSENLIHLPAHKTKALKERWIPISERLETEINKYFKENKFAPKDFIFFGQKSLRKSFAGVCRHAGVTGVTFHALRHTATSWMDEAGISQSKRKNIIGHSSDAVHQRYNNLSADTLGSVRDQMNDFRRDLESKVNAKVKT